MSNPTVTSGSATGHANQPEISREILQRCRNRLARMHKMLRRYG